MGALEASRPSCFASVIIPTHRRPLELQRALASLISQDETSWEALVVDDGAGEGIATVVETGDDRIRGVSNPGRGQVDARNVALVLARGEYICWMDDDDWWEDQGHLGALRKAAVEGPAIFHRGGWLVDEQGNRQIFDWDATADSLRENSTVLTSSIAYPRTAHRNAGLLDSALGGYCDWDILLRLTETGLPIRKLPGLGICYAIHSGGVSADPQRPEWVRLFTRLQSKHGLMSIKVQNHATLARELGQAKQS